MSSCTDGRDSYRYERKFLVSRHLQPRLADVILSAPQGFREIYHGRVVNNVYFDTPGFRFFQENRQGYPYREKVRVRWYGEDGIQSPRLELKHRNGLVGTKDVLPLHEAKALWEPRSFDLLAQEAPEIREMVPQLVQPVLYNRYYRKYYLSGDGLFRVTVDTRLCYEHPRELRKGCGPLGQGNPLADSVVELKYAGEHDSEADSISRFWPFRLAKKSKYVSGVCQLFSLPE
ncbi:polyphosphate polymerase domain-containing protein [Desulfobaculum bizertense]|uniref:VTC domain-containing protein n=1 Tax=Desulfobaculum bizertense DSM 18034 TaxID=1121442 RepID=A0A1T4WKB6_9BACT|nr:polyphosphate polymerase domain-containing protein [Desulfobaculum bizertense]UIJ37096.1 polyphosphate polymerase domain-containing protein [Desulfobaculum bizertense]SKA77764.1 VTC domain-containing protein [Desulfobaculum bizertense DSM 18034]